MKNLCGIYAKTYLNYKVYNRERLRGLNDGGYVVASNHVSFLDPPLVGIAFPENIYYFARKTLFDKPFASWMLHRMWAIPVDQARPEMSTLKKIIQLLKDGEKVVIFPEGERTYDGNLKEVGQSGVGMIVEKSKAKVLPVRLFGPEKALPRNSKKVVKVPVTMVVGEPMDLSDLINDKTIDKRTKYEAITARIMDAIREIECPEERKV
ncbi:MAG: lysophospholipid acyltransferase family protein [Verrucomicrobiales bacterium]|nr:lysophospholipid acyltransferase family protein [Verrucomicrobiales bacterium]